MVTVMENGVLDNQLINFLSSHGISMIQIKRMGILVLSIVIWFFPGIIGTHVPGGENELSKLEICLRKGLAIFLFLLFLLSFVVDLGL